MKNSLRFRGHESFILREGWLNKGLLEVSENPAVFRENSGADALGVGVNMAKAIRYWLRCSGLTQDKGRGAVTLTDMGRLFLEKDPYFEDIFSLWIVHCNIAGNLGQASAWWLFFHQFQREEFTRRELEQDMIQLADQMEEGKKHAQRSIEDDCDAILRMYLRKHDRESDPEEKNNSPFGRLGLLKEEGELYVREQPLLSKLPAEVVWYLLTGLSEMEQGITIEELLTIPGGPGKLLNLRRMHLVELLEQLEQKERVILNRTAGLDMVYLPGRLEPEKVMEAYYQKY